MKALGQILLYLAAVVLLGALLAPPLFWLAHAAAGHLHDASFSAFIAKTDFQRYFDRGILVAALALLWPLLRAFRIENFGHDLGLRRDRHGWRRLFAGAAVALGTFLALWAILYFAGLCRLRGHVNYGALMWQVPLTAVTVSVLEEFFFRGALQGAVRKTTVDGFALVTVAVLFAAVHFLKPAGAEIAPADVHWWSGLAVLPDTLWMFQQPGLLLGGFTTLLLVGLILGYARMRTRSLWMPVGLHAGWIVGEKGLGALTRHGVAWPWLGPNIPNTLVGLAPVLTLVAAWAIVALMLRDLPE
ncbi:MAG TPA: CPBP family intramembrane glutamic endopeptidase [Chthoniobacteraceae bacterium]|nr:CPBP family intramembrane glutamic endopeptidase [Chthoniobacteraceae bacterium]